MGSHFLRARCAMEIRHGACGRIALARDVETNREFGFNNAESV